MNKNIIPGAAAPDKARTREDARKWAEQHLAPKAIEHLFALADEGLFNLTQLLYVDTPSRDGPGRRLADVLIYRDGKGAWLLFNSNDSHGKLKKFPTKRAAVAAARWIVWNADMRDGKWRAYRAG